MELIEIKDLNCVRIEMHERIIFQCNIKNLFFNMKDDEDIICNLAVRTIEEASKRICSALNIPKYMSIKKGIRSLMPATKPKNIQEYFSDDIQIIYEI